MLTTSVRARRANRDRGGPKAERRATGLDLEGLAHPNLKGWWTWNGAFLLGPRYVRLLEQIDRSGSIREACPSTGMSYRTCLTRIRRLEATLGTHILTTHRGGAGRGGSALTPAARHLVRVYRFWREDVELASQRAFVRAVRRAQAEAR